MTKLLSNLCLLILSLVFSFVVLESGSRYYLFNIATPEDFQKYASLSQLAQTEENSRYVDWNSHFKYSFHRYIGYIPTPGFEKGKNKHNSLGYRGDEFPLQKPDGEFRIVCLGGSTTYTSFTDNYQLSYPYLLEKELHQQGYNNVRVINGGAGGWSSWETLINFQLRVQDLEPDLIIVYHNVNDIRSRLVWPHDKYLGDNSGYAIPNITNVFMPNILEYSTLVRMLLIKTGIIYPHTAIIRTTHKVNKENWFDSKFVHQKIKNTYPSGIFEKTSAMTMLETNKPIYFQRNLENLISSASSQQTQTVLASFAYSTEFEDNPRSSSKEYQFAYAEHNQIIKELTEKTGVNYFDFYSAFPKDKSLYTDGFHVNEKGAALKAQLFSEYLINNKLLIKAQ